MSTAAQLSSAAASMLGGNSIPQAPADVGRAEDVYAAWKAVFEGSRAVEPARDGAHPFEPDFDQPHGEPPVRGDTSHVQTASSGDDAPRSCEQHSEVVSSNRAGVSSKAIAKGASGSHAESAPSCGSSSAPLLRQSASIDKAAPVRSGTARVAPEPAGAVPGSVAQPVPADWVQVFVRGTAVAIVVRDTSLSADEAMHCAFQTARELTGRSDALRHLTLNGRTIYQQHRSSAAPEPPQAAGQRARSLEFAC